MNSSSKTKKVRVTELFGFESDLEVHKFIEYSERVPAIDETYKFDKETTLAKLSNLVAISLLNQSSKIKFFRLGSLL